MLNKRSTNEMPVEGKYLTNIFNGFPINICCSVRARVPYQVGNTRGVLELRFDKKNRAFMHGLKFKVLVTLAKHLTLTLVVTCQISCKN